jgi:hypothetical protein
MIVYYKIGKLDEDSLRKSGCSWVSERTYHIVIGIFLAIVYIGAIFACNIVKFDDKFKKLIATIDSPGLLLFILLQSLLVIILFIFYFIIPNYYVSWLCSDGACICNFLLLLVIVQMAYDK